MPISINFLEKKAEFVRRETLLLHGLAPETRIASSLSCVEILVALFYGKLAKFYPDNLSADDRDRIIISKGHGSISFYPILADLGYFSKSELKKICKPGSFLGGIPDCIIPGYETTNGSLGHGPGVACGIALALKNKKNKAHVFVLLGDGEMQEGSVWEAIMFAGHHQLNNMTFIVDNNKVGMLDFTKNIINMEPLTEIFSMFGWDACETDGHSLPLLLSALKRSKSALIKKPKVIVANTIKGKGVPRLETDSLSHIRTLSGEEISKLIEVL
jgi:transketolase